MVNKRIDSIESYLEYVGRGKGDAFGRRYRSQFRDRRGTAELAMLAAPSEEEYGEFRRVVSVMTQQEKERPEELSDEQIQGIAQRCEADSGNVSIFLNGYILARRENETRAGQTDKET